MADKERTSRRYLTEKEAAEFLGVAERTLRDWRRKGCIDGKGTKPPRAYVRSRMFTMPRMSWTHGSERARLMQSWIATICGRSV